MKEKEIDQLKLKMIDICEELYVSFETIRGLSDVLVEYSIDNIESNEPAVFALISVLSEKINKYHESYDKFEDFLFKEVL